MTNYYFLASLLPSLRIGNKTDLAYPELQELLATNLKPSDMQQVDVIRRYYDIENVRSYWLKEPFNVYGNVEERFMEEAILTGDGLPPYVYDFMDRFESHTARLEHFPMLVSEYFQEEIPKASGFLQEYLHFEHDWRLIATAHRAKMLNRDLSLELQGEDPHEDLVAMLLAQKEAKHWILPERFNDLLARLTTHEDNPMALYRALCEWRFDNIAAFTATEFFSIDRILSYLVRLIVVEQYAALDRTKGLGLVAKIVKEAS